MSDHDDSGVNLLFKSSIIYVIATAIGQGMSFLGIIVFTRLMGQAEYGAYSTYYAYVSMLTVFIGANLYFSLNNAYIDKKNEIMEFRKSVLLLSVIIMLLITVVLLFITRIVLNCSSFFIIMMAVIHSYGFFVITYRVYSANMENDYKKKQWLLILPNTLSFTFAVMFILMLPGMAYEARIIGSTIGVDIVALIVFVEMMKGKKAAIDAEYWKYALSIAIPTIIMSLSYMLMQQCDKVMIRNICGVENTAVYSVIYYIGYALVAVDQAIAPVRQAWLFQQLNRGDVSEAKKVQKWYLVIIGLLATFLIMTGPEMVKILAPKTYWKYEYIVPFVLSACMMVLYRFYVEVILFYKCNATLSIIVLICAGVNIGLNALLIPVFGSVTACYTTIIAYGLLFILAWKLSNRYIQKIYEWRYFTIFVCGTAGISIVFSFVQDMIISRYVILMLIILISFVYGIRTKKEWRSLLWEENN